MKQKRSVELSVDLENQIVSNQEGFSAAFSLPNYQKEMLLNGWDEIALTLLHENRISEYEKKQEINAAVY